MKAVGNTWWCFGLLSLMCWCCSRQWHLRAISNLLVQIYWEAWDWNILVGKLWYVFLCSIAGSHEHCWNVPCAVWFLNEKTERWLWCCCGGCCSWEFQMRCCCCSVGSLCHFSQQQGHLFLLPSRAHNNHIVQQPSLGIDSCLWDLISVFSASMQLLLPQRIHHKQLLHFHQHPLNDSWYISEKNIYQWWFVNRLNHFFSCHSCRPNWKSYRWFWEEDCQLNNHWQKISSKDDSFSATIVNALGSWWCLRCPWAFPSFSRSCLFFSCCIMTSWTWHIAYCV